MESRNSAATMLVPLIFVSLMAIEAGCQPTVNNSMPKGDLMRTLKLKKMTMEITQQDMEAIRKVVVAKIMTTENDEARYLATELEESILVLGERDSRLGPWELTDRNEGLALVRMPPRNVVNYIFVASLAREKDNWIVTDFSQERMNAR